MATFDVYLRVDSKLNYGDRHIFLQTFDSEEKAIAFCQSVRKSFLPCEDLQCQHRKPYSQLVEAIPLFIMKRGEN